MKSIISYPDRGSWGDALYRGNTSGHVIKDVIQQFFPSQPPKQFIEVFSGGGTGEDVAADLGVKNSIHLDLNSGWNVLTDEIPFGSDLIFSHPPYWNIISYQRYNGGHPDDLSLNMSYEEFISKLDQVNAKIYQSLLNGGRHAFLVGDVRRKGAYYSIIKDMTWFGSLEAHIIKAQHNTLSDNKQYSNNNFIPISHEHLLVFKKDKVWILPIKSTVTKYFDLRQFNNITWRDLIQGALEWLGGKAELTEIYKVIEGSKRTLKNSHWKDKIRQTLQLHDNFWSSSRGVWELKFKIGG
ncbi:DNA methyltransferase [Oceanobacillus oncorhynchi]|uniref:DNA methyltransferase n=1 Tax=Oceanobacillus oncorhynchi TaxID=545501 RepID=UPI001865B0D2|nr:DNA methyltransferase [Oceanobacillus oncorhynchi]